MIFPLFLFLRALGGTVSYQLRRNLRSYHNLNLVPNEPCKTRPEIRAKSFAYA
jgi:hypothetical protein